MRLAVRRERAAGGAHIPRVHHRIGSAFGVRTFGGGEARRERRAVGIRLRRQTVGRELWRSRGHRSGFAVGSVLAAGGAGGGSAEAEQ